MKASGLTRGLTRRDFMGAVAGAPAATWLHADQTQALAFRASDRMAALATSGALSG